MKNKTPTQKKGRPQPGSEVGRPVTTIREDSQMLTSTVAPCPPKGAVAGLMAVPTTPPRCPIECDYQDCVPEFGLVEHGHVIWQDPQDPDFLIGVSWTDRLNDDGTWTEGSIELDHPTIAELAKHRSSADALTAAYAFFNRHGRDEAYRSIGVDQTPDAEAVERISRYVAMAEAAEGRVSA